MSVKDIIFGLKLDAKQFEKTAKDSIEHLKRINMSSMDKIKASLEGLEKSLDAKHAKNIKDMTSAWDALRESMRKTGETAKTVHVGAGVGGFLKKTSGAVLTGVQTGFAGGGLMGVSGGVGAGIGGMLGAFGGPAGAVLGAAAGAGVAKSVTSGFEATLGAGMDNMTVNDMLKGTIERAGQSISNKDFDHVKEVANSAFHAFHIDDSDIKKGYAELIQGGMNYQQALQQTGLIADIARSKNISAAKAAEYVSRAYNGETVGLRTLGVYIAQTGDKTKDAQASMRALYGSFGGAAAKAAADDSPLKVIRETLSHLAGEVGEKIAPIVLPMLKSLSDWFTNFDAGTAATAIEGFGEKVMGFMGGVKTAFDTVYYFLTGLPTKVASAFQSGELAQGMFAFLGGVMVGLSKIAWAALKTLGKLVLASITTGAPLLIDVLLKLLFDGIRGASPKLAKFLGLDSASKSLGEKIGKESSELKDKSKNALGTLVDGVKSAIPDFSTGAGALMGTLGGKEALAKAHSQGSFFDQTRASAAAVAADNANRATEIYQQGALPGYSARAGQMQAMRAEKPRNGNLARQEAEIQRMAARNNAHAMNVNLMVTSLDGHIHPASAT